MLALIFFKNDGTKKKKNHTAIKINKRARVALCYLVHVYMLFITPQRSLNTSFFSILVIQRPRYVFVDPRSKTVIDLFRDRKLIGADFVYVRPSPTFRDRSNVTGPVVLRRLGPRQRPPRARVGRRSRTYRNPFLVSTVARKEGTFRISSRSVPRLSRFRVERTSG